MIHPFCYNCGQALRYSYIFPVDEDLKKTWELPNNLLTLFNRREGSICQSCGVNIRAQGLAKAILDSKYGYGEKSLRQWVIVANANKIKVCELNKCHELHETLKKLKGLTYAEFGTNSQQNIESMTYKNNSFDLFLHSETLEHVNKPSAAMKECRRVIKSNGLILFTTPIIWNRNTRQRATLKSGKIVYLLQPSYHGKRTDDYLVYYEYGRDSDNILGSEICYADWRNQNYVFSSGKNPTKIKNTTKLKFALLEKTAQITKA